jgi:large subunit ribosomal protein LP1
VLSRRPCALLPCSQPGKGVYHYKVDMKALKATPYGDMAEELPACEGASMYELEKAMVAACAEISGTPTFNYENSMVTPAAGLFTACIGTQTMGGGGGGGGGGAAPAAAAGGAAPAAAAKAPEPEPEPEEEEEDMGFDLVRGMRPRRMRAGRPCLRLLRCIEDVDMRRISVCRTVRLSTPWPSRGGGALQRWLVVCRCLVAEGLRRSSTIGGRFNAPITGSARSGRRRSESQAAVVACLGRTLFVPSHCEGCGGRVA